MARASQSAGPAVGVWKKDSVKDVAESVGIANLPDEVATALAGDVEYRLYELIEESLKFMQHSRRTRLKVDDVDHALKARNLEPLWGFASTSHLPFKRTQTATGVVYHVEDEEVDLGKVLKTQLPSIPRDVSYTAHWLAIEGVQPLIKENPSPSELAKYASKSTLPSANQAAIAQAAVASGSTSQGPTSVTPLVKHVLSRELQLYFTRLTEALSLPGQTGFEMRQAALGSVRNDPGLHQLVPYLISWGGEQIASHLDDLGVLERALDLFAAMLDNAELFIEPYLHQLTPPILTCLLTSILPPPTPASTSTPHLLRQTSASLLLSLLTRFSLSYPTLKPRITKTLLRGLGGVDRGLGGRWGAARGLRGIVGEQRGGNMVVRDWIGSNLRELGLILENEEETGEVQRSEVVAEILTVLVHSVLQPDVEGTPPPLPSVEELEARYGSLFGPAILQRWDDGGKDIWESVPGSGGGEEEEGAAEGMEED